MSSETRDARRWATYERLAADPAAAPSERAQAVEQLATLRARYPNGRPGRREAPEPGRWTGRRTYAHGWAWQEPPEPDPAARAASEAEDRLRHKRAVEVQQQSVERVPRWETSVVLRDLHSCRGAWSEEEQAAFKAARIRLTGSSRAVDL
jgi:hypothetical protein